MVLGHIKSHTTGPEIYIIGFLCRCQSSSTMDPSWGWLVFFLMKRWKSSDYLDAWRFWLSQWGSPGAEQVSRLKRSWEWFGWFVNLWTASLFEPSPYMLVVGWISSIIWKMPYVPIIHLYASILTCIMYQYNSSETSYIVAFVFIIDFASFQIPDWSDLFGGQLDLRCSAVCLRRRAFTGCGSK